MSLMGVSNVGNFELGALLLTVSHGKTYVPFQLQPAVIQEQDQGREDRVGG